MSVDPPFGPEEGGTIVTITGTYFSDEPVAQRQRRVVLSHSGDGGAPRECCETRRVSATLMTCRLPRVSCLSSNPTNPCPRPGRSFVNQTVSIAIQPGVKGFAGGVAAAALDDFVSYEGTWELVDEDVYGGLYVSNANRVAGEQYILNTPRDQAIQRCCPVCSTPGDPSCQITIKQAVTSTLAPRPGVYVVTVPGFMRPAADSGLSGACDAASNYVNDSLTMGVELSSDPRGFTPDPPLSITSCIDMTGACRSLPRVSIRSTCRQLMWSTGSISATLPIGQTVEVYTWLADGGCDRRLRCVGGPCSWTSLVNTSGPGQPTLQRRASSAQIGLQVAYMNPNFDPDGFLAALSKVVLPQPGDSRRLQQLRVLKTSALPTDVLGTTFAVREAFRLQPASLCTPDAGYSACTLFSLVIYLLSDAPGTLGSEVAAQNALYSSASSPTGDPKLRMLGVYMVCFDTSNIPVQRAAGNMYQCVKVQYPGFIQMDPTLTSGGSLLSGSVLGVRVAEQVWSYADIVVTRTGGSDLGVTVDYRTVEYNRSGIDVARGLGKNYFSKVGQLRWLPQDTAPKHIIVPIRRDGVTKPSRMFEVWIYSVVNGSMANDTQRAVVTIVGINNWPEPRYINNMLRIIGAVCGAATLIPCALFAARLVRSFRREMARGLALGKESGRAEAETTGGKAAGGPKKPQPIA